MRRTSLPLLALVLVAVSPGRGQDTQASAPDSTRGTPLYTYKRADYASDLAAAKNAAQRLQILDQRWKAIKLAVAHAHVVTGDTFYSSVAFWRSGYLHSGGWNVNAEGDLTTPVRRDAEAAVLVHGDCLQPVTVTNGAVIHVLGDLTAAINVKGHCEVVVGGDVKKGGSIRGDGIVRIFVGGDVHGSVQNVGSSTVWIAGNLDGEVETGTPSTDLHVMGNITGGISPAGEASLLSVEVRGHVPSRILVQTADRHYTEFQATVGSSDKPAGLYTKDTASWVIHQQRSD